MFSSGILDLLIGLALLYFLLATLCLALQELMAGLFASRAKVLVAALENMLGDAKGLLDGFFAHPAVRAISGPSLGKTGFLTWFRGKGAGKPSYVAAGTFCQVLIDLVLSRTPQSAAPQKSVLLDLTGPEPDRAEAGFALLKRLHETVAELPDSGAKRMLSMALNEARGDIDRAKAGIEAWFNGTMERASGWYKRHTQCWVLVYAIALTVALNGDSIMVVNALSTDESTRQSVAAFAAGVVERPPSSTGEPADASSRVAEILELTRQSHLTLGWVLRKSDSDGSALDDPRRFPRDASKIAVKILGLLVTVLAISLGAPFWFDLLNRLVNLRSTGKPPDPRKAEPPPTPAPPPFEKGAAVPAGRA
jgi:hypothetical protein